MSAEVACPACSRRLRLPDGMDGRTVRCPACGEAFTAPMREEPPTPTDIALERFADAPVRSPPDDQPPPLEPPSANFEMGPPAPPFDEDTPAPSRLDDWRRRPPRRDSEPHRGSLVLTLGIISLVLFNCVFPISFGLGLAAWLMGRGDLLKMRSGEMDASGSGSTQAGWICGIIGTILSALYGVACVGYFGLIFVMVRQATPPMPPPPMVAPMPVPPKLPPLQPEVEPEED